MADQLIIRSYQPGDESAITDLFQSVFGRPMSAAYWRWRFASNPTGETVIDLAWMNGQLVSHHAVSPVSVWIGQREHLSGLSMTIMTHPAYQGRGLFTALAERVYARTADRAMAMVWGFPNLMSHRGLVCYLDWEDIYEVPTFRRILHGNSTSMPRPSAHVTELESFDARFNHLWKEVRNEHRVITKRDLEYLDWRYGANPQHEYTVLGYLREDQLLGYAVCKVYRNDVDLVDLLSVEDTISLDLVYEVGRRALEKEARAINLWLNVSSSLHRELEKLGFRNGAPVTYFGARVLKPELDVEVVRDFRNWYLTMGDSDVY